MKKVVALDIGGSKIEGVLFDENFKKLKKERIYFEKKPDQEELDIPKDEALKVILDLFYRLKGDEKVQGLGVSFPDMIDPNGQVKGWSKIKSLSQFPLKKYFEKQLGCKVSVANDADCFALGEQACGAGKGFQNVVGVIWGTGVGAGVVLNGRLYVSSFGGAGEVGKNVVDPTGPNDRSGIVGTVEAFSSGPGLTREYIKRGGKIENPDPRKIFHSKEKVAQEVLDNLLEHFSMGLGGIVNILVPDRIVLGGGLSQLPVYAKLNRLTKQYVRPGLRPHVKIVKNKLGDSAGVYGAAALVFGE